MHDPLLSPSHENSFTLPLPENRSAIQHAIGQIMKQLADNALDPRRAGLLLYALQIASINLAQAPRHSPDEIVQDVTLDPAQGTLAPKNEVPGDREYRESLQALDEDDEDDYDDGEDEDQDDRAPHSTYSRTLR